MCEHSFSINGMDFLIAEVMTEECLKNILAGIDCKHEWGKWVWTQTVGPVAVAESDRFDSLGDAKRDAVRYANLHKDEEPYDPSLDWKIAELRGIA